MELAMSKDEHANVEGEFSEDCHDDDKFLIIKQEITNRHLWNKLCALEKSSKDINDKVTWTNGKVATLHEIIEGCPDKKIIGLKEKIRIVESASIVLFCAKHRKVLIFTFVLGVLASIALGIANIKSFIEFF